MVDLEGESCALRCRALIGRASADSHTRSPLEFILSHARSRSYNTSRLAQIPSLRILDFQRIKDAERKAARELFVDAETQLPTKLALSLTTDAAAEEAAARAAAALKASAGGGGTAAAGVKTGAGAGKGRLLSDDERTRIREAILRTSSVEEIKRLEKMLNEGRVPEGAEI